ncbi:MAG: hypothetical protein US50_C0038G0011 [Candidatus Nomurabacteria bacterium GW2011_GWB1_37_5]|uniref:Uncharacterized protein n=1 Tax=Candidatus Nomurabacteria bacterium GW2011_GWB1_37_5 TaxID=1618742 RepID=A0A0G0K290_9BACT|nr:MAG: hypothetical protein US50_C0038G0011 [Candidatus Nomurabacteria bacterium GW2011_GWB1_37_5]
MTKNQTAATIKITGIFRLFLLLAEGEGFEPSVGFPTQTFQVCALDRYANPPMLLCTNISRLRQ